MGYGLAILLEDKQLTEFCEEKIKCNTKETLSSSSFLECDRKVLKGILLIDSLSCTAVELINAYMLWLKSISKQEQLTRELVEEHFGDLFYKIPFGSLSIKEFAAFDCLYGNIFTHDEHREIIQMIGSEDFEPTIFSAKRERFYGISPIWNEDALITCNRYCLSSGIQYVPYYIKNVETTTFSINEPLVLGTIHFMRLMLYGNGSWYDANNISTKITITKINRSTANRTTAYNGQLHLSAGGCAGIRLPKPLLISPGFLYEIRMEQNPPAHCCTQFQLKNQVKMKPGVIIKFYGSTDNEMKRGLIWKLDFNDVPSLHK